LPAALLHKQADPACSNIGLTLRASREGRLQFYRDNGNWYVNAQTFEQLAFTSDLDRCFFDLDSTSIDVDPFLFDVA
jgi:hypothetical protein